MVYYVNWFMNMSFGAYRIGQPGFHMLLAAHSDSSEFAGVPTPEKVSKFTKLRESAQVQYNEDDPEHQVREHIYDGVSKGPYMRFSSAFPSIFNSTMVPRISLYI